MQRRQLLTMASGALVAPVLSGATVPRPSPDITIQLPNGGTVSPQQHRGRVVALAFISSTCPHCQKLTQILNGIQNEFGPRGVQVLETDFTEGAARQVPNLIRQYQPTYPLGWCDRDAAMRYLEISLMMPGYVPKLVFIDRTGTIRAQYDGSDPFFKNEVPNIKAKLEELLNEKPPAAAPAKPRRASSRK